mmetsp:Transcript_46447/g.131329  ORF Transcript_46447/g.131329 Transcript_46447/m.131329 type:complete len:118 (+) Transcript_46447:259-612(+)
MGEESKEVKMKLIFQCEPPSTQEIEVSMSAVVRDVKKLIMESHWPPTLTAIEGVERLRLFAGGKELGGKDVDDNMSLREAKLVVVSQPYPTPVHVQPVLRSTEKETAKPSQCFCVLL